MHKILSLWAIPRSTSTAFEWMMRQRGDFLCRHEPFGEVWYFGEDRRTHRENTVIPIPGLNYRNVWESLKADAVEQPVFIKEFPHYVLHMADDDFLDRFTHTFLIRDPAKMLPSMWDKWPDFLLAETGYEEQHELFDRICQRNGASPPAIDSDDLLADPAGIVRHYCEAVGLRFIEEALVWDAGERGEVGWYDKGSWHENLKSSTGLKPQKRTYVSIDHNDHLKTCYAACRPHYDALYEHRLQPPTHEPVERNTNTS